jgi:hypothetical protein
MKFFKKIIGSIDNMFKELSMYLIVVVYFPWESERMAILYADWEDIILKKR